MRGLERSVQDVSFKRLAGGEWGFFPHGPWGRGRVVPAPVDPGQLRGALAREAVWGLALLGLVGALGGPLAWGIGAALQLGVAELALRRRTAGWAPTDERLSTREVWRRRARRARPAGLWATGLAAAAGSALGARLLGVPGSRAAGLLLLVASVGCVLDRVLLWRAGRADR